MDQHYLDQPLFEFDHHNIAQLMKIGFEPHYINPHDYDHEAWKRQGQPPGRVDAMVYNWPEDVAPGMYMTLYNDGHLDAIGGSAKKFYNGNPLGVTLAHYTTEPGAPEPPRMWPKPEKKLGMWLPPHPDGPAVAFDIEHVKWLIKYVNERLTTRRKTRRFNI